MYKYTLFNNDCILNTETNTVIYKGEPDWNLYQEWKKKNPQKDSDSLKEREHLLNWNGGNPKNINGKDTYFDKQSNVIKTKTDNETLFYNKGKLYKQIKHKDGIDIEICEYSPEGVKFKKTDLIKNVIKEYDVIEGWEVSHKSYRKDLEYTAEISYPADIPLIIETEIKKSDILLQRKTWFSCNHSTKRRSTLKRKNDKYEYKEYYLSGVLRSEGTLCEKNLMNGSWTFYHQNGRIASTHTFKDGNPINESCLYYENSKLIKRIKYD